jgi:hypothetical protein
MKPVFSFLLLFQILFVYAQKIRVVDAETKEPVAFATILLIDAEEGPVSGGYCNQDGTFAIPANGGYDAAEISCLGFKTKKIIKGDIKEGDIVLTKDVFQLKEIVVSGTPNVDTLGYINEKKLDFKGVSKTSWDGVFIENPYNTPAYVKTFMFRALKVEKRFAYRLHFFEVDNSRGGRPGKEITPVAITCIAEKGTKGLVEIDIAPYGIEMPAQGIFVVIEGLGNCDDSGNLIRPKKETSLLYEAHQSARQYGFYRPAWFINDGWSESWINENKVRSDDYTYFYNKPIPSDHKWLHLPSFGLRVIKP